MRLALESKYIDKLNYDVHYNDAIYYDKCESSGGSTSQSFIEFRSPKKPDAANKPNDCVKDDKHTQNCTRINGKSYKCAHCNKLHKKIICKKNNNNKDGIQRKKLKSYSCAGCSTTFRNLVQLRKHSRACKSAIKNNRKCPDINCKRTFSKLILLLNHLKEHLTEAGLSFEFYTLQEFENWQNKFGNEFVLVKTFKTKATDLIYRYYVCQFEITDGVSSTKSICQGKVFVTKKSNGAVVKYMPHDQLCKWSKKTVCQNLTTEATTLEDNLHQKDKLRSILSNHRFNEVDTEKDIESVKKSIRDRISQLDECVSAGDVQSLLNIEYVLQELLKMYTKTDTLVESKTEPTEQEKVPESNEPFTSELKYADDVNKVAFNVGPYSISSLHLKSLDYNIPSAECAILKSVAQDFRKGWLYDTILDAFLYMLCKPHPNAMFLETAVSQIINSNSLNSLRMQLGDKYFTNIENIFVTFNPNGKHWVLLVVKPKLKQIQIYDPTSKKKTTSQSLMKFVKQLICVLLNDFGPNETWNIVVPKHIIQKGNYNCGVYVCWYAERILKNEDVVTEFSASEFRKYIFNFIGGHGDE
ncbi:uncharacterized protein LOC135837477 [Planococcus citri]|uniref:uncharacterized protein LOC135837477 n=1 Tax=Planococcus citri TaxID=170843 RepID=UPI0031F8AE89